MKHLEKVSQFANNYDAFILDLWGVIHDGQKLYPGVAECLMELLAKDKQILFLSNAPRRSEKVMNVLTKFGIQRESYITAISSGEIGYHIIKNTETPESNFIYIGPDKDRDLMDGSGFKVTDDTYKATFAIATGFDGDESTLEEKLPIIEQCLNAGLRLYCVNPDRKVVRQDGSSQLCAGIIGEYYAEQGGQTRMIGKPYPEVYDGCFGILDEIPKEKIIAVGDNLDTDILGANLSGIDSALCLGGILANEERELDDLMKEAGAEPTYTIPSFRY